MKKVKNDYIDALMIAALIKSGRYSKAYVSEDMYQSIKNNSHLVGYLGLYPTLEQSGNKLVFGPIAKRGAKLAKKALYQAAIAAIRHNDELNKLFRDKVSQGRAKKEAVVIVARKLAHIILSIYKNNVAYNPQRVFQASVS